MLKRTTAELIDLKIFDETHIHQSAITEENKSKVIQRGDYYYYLVDTHGLSQEDIKLELMIKQTQHIRTIKNIAIFFLVSFLVSILAYVILLSF